MKKHPVAPLIGFLCIVFSIVIISCKKSTAPSSPREIRYILYTKEDISTDHDTIRFRLRMQTIKTPNGTILLDSPLAAMTISAIPDSMHRLIFTKTVPAGHENDKLLIGFIYDIDNVGESWYLDSSVAGQRTKTVEYSFR